MADQKAIWTAPLLASPKKQPLLVPIGLTAIALLATDLRTQSAISPTHSQQVWSGRVSQIGASYTLAGGLAAAIVFGKLTDRPEVVKTGVRGAEAFANSMILVQTLKMVAGRSRPDADTGRGKFFHDGTSFPSGHAIGAFSVASVIAHNPRVPKWAKITSYGVATAVSLSRVGARRHFLGDVFVGGTAGYLIGSYVAHRP